MLLHLYLVLQLLLHGHLLFLFFFLPVVVLILLLVVLLIFVGALVDLGDVRALGVVLLLLVGVVFLLVVFVAHVLLLLVFLDGLSTHHVVVHPLRYLRTFLLLFFSLVVIFPVVHILLLLLLLLLLLVLLKHEEILLAETVNQSLRGEVAGEVGGGRIESIVVLCREEELLLLVGQVGVGVEVCLSENVNVLLQLTDLSQVPHEGFGDLFDQQWLVGNVEKDLLLLLGVDSLQDCVLLACLL